MKIEWEAKRGGKCNREDAKARRQPRRKMKRTGLRRA
jgi:hypothetical protein